MIFTRKKYIVDKKLQVGMSLRAVALPFLSFVIISLILIYVVLNNGKLISNNEADIKSIIDRHDSIIHMFMSSPALLESENPIIREGIRNFRENISELKKVGIQISRVGDNTETVLCILIFTTVIQSILIFIIFIYFSHKISGPLYVMLRHIREIRQGVKPQFRPLRKGDYLKEFYNEFRQMIQSLIRADK